MLTSPCLPIIEFAVTELIGINEAVAQNQHSASVAITLGTQPVSGEILSFAFYSQEAGTGAVLQPTGKLILLDADPATAAEGYTLRFLAVHAASGASDLITVHTDHQPILVLFVVWRALKERQALESANPDTTSKYLNQLVYASTQAEVEYRRALERAKTSRSHSGPVGPWRSDTYDPIY